MKILVLAGIIPATTNMPGSPRLFNLCKGLSRDHSLSLVTFPWNEARYRAFQADPSSAGVFDKIWLLPLPPEATWWGRQLHRFRQEPYWGTRFRAPGYHAGIRRALRNGLEKGQFDALYVDGLGEVQYVADNPIPCPALIDLHDCLVLLYQRNVSVERRWIRKLRLYAEMRSIARLERSLSRTFGAVLTNSPVDEEFIKTLDPAADTYTIANGVDCDFFSPGPPQTDLSRLLFTGVMDYGPNEDAALHFARDILPAIREAQPATRFEVVGKDPTAAVRGLGAIPGVDVVGEVPDVRPYLESAGIFVCPLRWGAGVKNKVLAALAMEKPVVATRRSAEGLALRDGVDILLADDPSEFARKVLSLMADPEMARSLGCSGRQVVRDTYSWESSARKLDEVLRSLVERARGRSGTPRAS